MENKKISYDLLNIFIGNFLKINNDKSFNDYDVRENLKIFFLNNGIKNLDFRTSENRIFLNYVYEKTGIK